MNKRSTSVVGVCVALFSMAGAVGCGSRGDDAGSGSGSGPGASGAAQAAVSPSLAAIAAGTWKDPGGGPDLKLAVTTLDKCYGFKTYSMKLPEGSTMKSLLGARSCSVDFPGPKKGYRLVVISDELKIALPTKDTLKNVKAKTYDSPDAFLFEVDSKGKTAYAGWWEAKLGKYTLRCNSIADADAEPFSFDFERAVIELCRTLKQTGL